MTKLKKPFRAWSVRGRWSGLWRGSLTWLFAVVMGLFGGLFVPASLWGASETIPDGVGLGDLRGVPSLFPIPPRVEVAGYDVLVYFSCVDAGNLRSFRGNPISEYGILTVSTFLRGVVAPPGYPVSGVENRDYMRKGDKYLLPLKFQVSSKITDNRNRYDVVHSPCRLTMGHIPPQLMSNPKNLGSISCMGNSVRAKFNLKLAAEEIKPDGTYQVERVSTEYQGTTYWQDASSSSLRREHAGRTGFVSDLKNQLVALYPTQVVRSFQGPGESTGMAGYLGGKPGFCGGWFSPLMLFFDDARPDFVGKSSFPLDSQGRDIYWPEKNAPGYFLAMDRNKDGRISEAQELFGEGPLFANGFEALRVWDANGDGKITPKDPVFRRLRLWNDRNSNGISEKNELFTLRSKGVMAIHLNYGMGYADFGGRARGGQNTFFLYGNAGGGKGKKMGMVVDMWFAPIERQVDPSTVVQSEEEGREREASWVRRFVSGQMFFPLVIRTGHE